LPTQAVHNADVPGQWHETMQAGNTALHVHLVPSSCEMQEPEMNVSVMRQNLNRSHHNLLSIHHSRLLSHSTVQTRKLLNKGRMTGNVSHFAFSTDSSIYLNSS
jgi:hypothetical protein